MPMRRRFVPLVFSPPSDYPGQSDFAWPDPEDDVPAVVTKPKRRSSLNLSQWDQLISWLRENHNGQTPEQLLDELDEAALDGLWRVPWDVFIEALRHADALGE